MWEARPRTRLAVVERTGSQSTLTLSRLCGADSIVTLVSSVVPRAPSTICRKHPGALRQRRRDRAGLDPLAQSGRVMASDGQGGGRRRHAASCRPAPSPSNHFRYTPLGPRMGRPTAVVVAGERPPRGVDGGRSRLRRQRLLTVPARCGAVRRCSISRQSPLWDSRVSLPDRPILDPWYSECLTGRSNCFILRCAYHLP